MTRRNERSDESSPSQAPCAELELEFGDARVVARDVHRGLQEPPGGQPLQVPRGEPALHVDGHLGPADVKWRDAVRHDQVLCDFDRALELWPTPELDRDRAEWPGDRAAAVCLPRKRNAYVPDRHAIELGRSLVHGHDREEFPDLLREPCVQCVLRSVTGVPQSALLACALLL